MNSVGIMMLGYLLAISDLTDDQTEAYYRDFYNQARSAQGLRVDTKEIGDAMHDDENRV